MVDEDGVYHIVDENYESGLPPYEIGRICFEPATFPPDDKEWHQIEIELANVTTPVPSPTLPPIMEEILIGPPNVIYNNEIEPYPFINFQPIGLPNVRTETFEFDEIKVRTQFCTKVRHSSLNQSNLRKSYWMFIT